MLTFHACIETLENRQLLSSVAWSAGPALPTALGQEAVIRDGSGKLYTFGGATSTVYTLASVSAAWGTASPQDSGSLAPGAATSFGFLVASPSTVTAPVVTCSAS